MRDARASVGSALEIIEDLESEDLAAIVYGPMGLRRARLRLNAAMVAGDDVDRVLVWAHWEIANGAVGSWLRARELDDLP